MFEHFGIMDILSGFRKYKYAIFAIITVAFALLWLNLVNTVKSVNQDMQTNEDKIFISSASYYVEPNKEILGTSDSNFYKTIPDDYIAMLNSDFCKKFIFDKLISLHSKKFIVENSGLNGTGAEVNPEEIGLDAVKELCFAKKYAGTMMIEISCITYNRQLSDELIHICEEFLISNADSKIVNASVKLYGQVSKSIKAVDIESENIDKNDKRNIVKAPVSKKITFKSVIKKVFIPIFLIIVLFTAFVIIMGFVRPTLNRRSDFEEYGAPVLGEIKNYKKVKGLK